VVEILNLLSLQRFTEKLAEDYLYSNYFVNLGSNTVFVLLEGNLGAGKTTFVKYLAKALKIKEEITSPTFSLISEYQSEKFDLYHLDFYRRIPSYFELLEILENTRSYAKTIICIEWINLIFSREVSTKSIRKIFKQKQNYLYLNFAFEPVSRKRTVEFRIKAGFSLES